MPYVTDVFPKNGLFSAKKSDASIGVRACIRAINPVLSRAMADAVKNNKSRNRKRSALKAVRVAARRRVMNLKRTKRMKDTMKQFSKSVAAKGDSAKLLADSYQAIDKALKAGILKKNTAARMKSGLARKLAK